MHNRDAFVAGMALEFLAMAKADLAKKFQMPTSASFNLQEEDVSRALEASLMENPDFFKIVAVMHGTWIHVSTGIYEWLKSMPMGVGLKVVTVDKFLANPGHHNIVSHLSSFLDDNGLAQFKLVCKPFKEIIDSDRQFLELTHDSLISCFRSRLRQR